MKLKKIRSRDGRPQYSTTEKINWLFPGDVHLPFQNDKALTRCLYPRPQYNNDSTGLFIGGDLVDMYWISTWPKSQTLTKKGGYTATREAIKDFVAKTSHFDYVVYGAGNHEARLEKLSKQYPGFDGKWYWMFQDILPTTWHYLDHGFRFVLPQKSISGLPIVLEHGDRALYAGVPSTSGLVAAYPNQCTVIGHNHRVSESHKTTWNKGKPQLTSAYSAGHLSSLKLNSWINNPDWQLGWVEIDSDGLVESRIYYDGRVL